MTTTSPTEQYRYEFLIHLLGRQARTRAEARRLDELVALIVDALPPERVGQAYRYALRRSA